MKKQLFVLASLCVLFAGCEKNTMLPRADHAAKNAHDSNGHARTGDQSESKEDLVLTQKIRAALVEDDALSTNAKNVKIITVNGVATLRGPVNSDKEKMDVARIAKAVSGIRSVDNQLEVIHSDDVRGDALRPINGR
jgi:hyperosmotically inducible protein